ncbi:MAG: CopG family transcriptional regulator [Candidatus Omnitrophica bacterium]|nr:CopG family transcriptional regulator [Candidatus Omnitrophota bacterium]
MSKRTVDADMPAGKLTRIKNVLPPPEQLVMPEETIKVTLLLSKASVKFFKHQATQYRTKYQRMIRELVDRYAERYAKGS